jgi:light-regulated signal transduction histidine kinase (bacteriophytochrome)
VLSHGTGSEAWYWHLVVPLLRQRGHDRCRRRRLLSRRAARRQGRGVCARGTAAIRSAITRLTRDDIRAHVESGGQIAMSDVALKSDGSVVQVQVKDIGCGIEPAEVPRIFKRFYVMDRARSLRGTGLRLAIVKHMALVHHGHVEVQSVPGAGSTVTLTLPCQTGRPQGEPVGERPLGAGHV